jgi:hypothetical protein
MDRNEDNAPVDPETILCTLDQLTQTVDVMNRVITRLRGYVQQNLAQQQAEFDFGSAHAIKPGPSSLH